MAVRQTVAFDGQANGTAVTAGGDIASVNGTPTYAAPGIHGTSALLADGTADSARVANTGTATHSGSWYARPTGISASAARVVQFTNAASNIVGSIRFHSDGKIDIGTPGNARGVASALTWVDGTLYRLDWQFDYAGTNPTLTVRIFAGANAEGTSPDETLGPFTLVTTNLMELWHLGALGGAAGQAVTGDTFRVADGLEWIGPFAPAGGAPGTVTHAWSGAPTTAGFRVRAKVAAATSVRLGVSTDPAMAGATLQGPQVPDGNGYVDFTVTGRAANTRYYYQLTDTPSGGSETAIGAIGRTKTLPAGSAGFTFAFGACSENNAADSAAPDSIRTWDPAFLLHLGDFHYRNPTSTDPAVHRGHLEAQITGAAGMAALLRDTPTVYIPSDHDNGPGDNGDSGTETAAAITAYEQIVPHHPLADARVPRRGRYHAFTVGRVRFVLLDVRTQDRTAGLTADSGAKTMLGATQEAWVATELARSEPVKVLVCDVGWLGAATTANGEDKWWSYATARAALGALCVGRNVVMLHGDTHALGRAAGASNPHGGFPVWCSAVLHQVGGGRNLASFDATWNNSGGACRAYGRVTVTDTGSQITLAFSGWDAAAGVERLADSVVFSAPAASTGTTSLDGLRVAWLGARTAGARMADREMAYFSGLSGLVGSHSLTSHKRVYYRNQLGLTAAQGAARSMVELETAFWAMIDPTNNVGSWADRARRFYAT